MKKNLGFGNLLVLQISLHADFVDQAVLELVNSGLVCRAYKQPFIVNPLSVSIQP